jgi:hypothetical protein
MKGCFFIYQPDNVMDWNILEMRRTLCAVSVFRDNHVEQSQCHAMWSSSVMSAMIAIFSAGIFNGASV